MVHLRGDVYCKKSVFAYAVSGGSSSATHVARRLLEGVFKNEAILKCTFTGQPARAQREKRFIAVQTLDGNAKDEIIGKFIFIYKNKICISKSKKIYLPFVIVIYNRLFTEFSMALAKEKKWNFQTRKEVQTSLTQRIGEIKRQAEMKKNKTIHNTIFFFTKRFHGSCSRKI